MFFAVRIYLHRRNEPHMEADEHSCEPSGKHYYLHFDKAGRCTQNLMGQARVVAEFKLIDI